MRILLVEDEKSLSAALCRLLQQERFIVDPVYTGPDGLDFALSGGYDAIILDERPAARISSSARARRVSASGSWCSAWRPSSRNKKTFTKFIKLAPGA